MDCFTPKTELFSVLETEHVLALFSQTRRSWKPPIVCVRMSGNPLEHDSVCFGHRSHDVGTQRAALSRQNAESAGKEGDEERNGACR